MQEQDDDDVLEKGSLEIKAQGFVSSSSAVLVKSSSLLNF